MIELQLVALGFVAGVLITVLLSIALVSTRPTGNREDDHER